MSQLFGAKLICIYCRDWKITKSRPPPILLSLHPPKSCKYEYSYITLLYTVLRKHPQLQTIKFIEVNIYFVLFIIIGYFLQIFVFSALIFYIQLARRNIFKLRKTDTANINLCVYLICNLYEM